MKNLIFGDFLFIFITLLIIAIPFTVAYIVYNNAKSRNMNAWIWTLVSVLLPYFVGVIIYLVVRQSYPLANARKCSVCNNGVQQGWKVCPNCGADLSITENTKVPVIKTASKVPFVLLGIEVVLPVLIIIIMLVINNLVLHQ